MVSNLNSSRVLFRNLTEEQLLPFFQSQMPDHPSGCAPFAAAMAANLFNTGLSPDTDYAGADVEAALERNLLKLHGFGIPTWWFYDRSLGRFAHGKVTCKRGAGIKDLEQALSAGRLPVVAVSWQTSKEILGDIPRATVGHYMVVVGFDPVTKELFFLNPADGQKEGIIRLYPLAYTEFEGIWLKKSNFFIPPGSMWVIGMKELGRSHK